jgi:hypothetical protein
MPSIQPLLGILYLYSLAYFFVHMGTNPNSAMFCKIIMDMDMLKWCKWKKFVLNFFERSLQPQNKTKLNTQHRKCLETCILHEIFVIV